MYERSIAVFPTAEAYTFRGWAYSLTGRMDAAIKECKHAIAVDPSFGNPYNDIGSYLVSLGRFDEAETWLKQAKSAPRYEPKHFPYMNLGRLYAVRGQLARAIAEFEGALKICPDELTCTAALGILRQRIN